MWTSSWIKNTMFQVLGSFVGLFIRFRAKVSERSKELFLFTRAEVCPDNFNVGDDVDVDVTHFSDFLLHLFLSRLHDSAFCSPSVWSKDIWSTLKLIERRRFRRRQVGRNSKTSCFDQFCWWTLKTGASPVLIYFSCCCNNCKAGLQRT